MSLFGNRKDDDLGRPQPSVNFEPLTPTLDEQSEDMKATAIEYIVSLDKADKDRFIEGVELIWQGYNNSVDKVRTRHQKALQRNLAKANGQDVATTDDEDDELIASFLDDDEVGKPNPIVTPPVNTLPPKRPLGGGVSTDITKKVEVKG